MPWALRITQTPKVLLFVLSSQCAVATSLPALEELRHRALITAQLHCHSSLCMDWKRVLHIALYTWVSEQVLVG